MITGAGVEGYRHGFDGFFRDAHVAGTESLLWQLVSEPAGTRYVAIDLGVTDRIDTHAGELLAEMSRRYLVNGRLIEFVDPLGLLADVGDVAIA